MVVETKNIVVESKPDIDMIDITGKIAEMIKQSKIKDGTVTIFVPGSTAGLSTIEYEPNLIKDFEEAIEKLVPSDIKYKHKETWGDDNGKSHIRATLMGPSLTIPFNDKKMMLGSWQNITLFDFDVPTRKREIVLQIMGE